MTPLKVYQLTALGLLVLNLVLLAVIVLAPPRPANNAPQRAIDTIGLDAEQHDRFITYAQAHQAEMRDYNARQNKLLEAYFRQLTTPSAANPGPPPAAIQDIEQQKIVSTYQHFLEVKALLRPEQEEQFPAFVDAVLQQILLEPKRE